MHCTEHRAKRSDKVAYMSLPDCSMDSFWPTDALCLPYCSMDYFLTFAMTGLSQAAERLVVQIAQKSQGPFLAQVSLAGRERESKKNKKEERRQKRRQGKQEGREIKGKRQSKKK